MNYLFEVSYLRILKSFLKKKIFATRLLSSTSSFLEPRVWVRVVCYFYALNLLFNSLIFFLSFLLLLSKRPTVMFLTFANNWWFWLFVLSRTCSPSNPWYVTTCLVVRSQNRLHYLFILVTLAFHCQQVCINNSTYVWGIYIMLYTVCGHTVQ